ncbi:MAG: hypothetical protein OQK29_09270, partial [Ignavibacteriaceae bacterium]|nr:hypothetical protein [Ignavibacteriaceae bacterium]
VPFFLPEKPAERRQHLNFHLDRVPVIEQDLIEPSPFLDRVAEKTRGFSGRDLKNLMQGSTRNAAKRTRKEMVEQKLLQQQIDHNTIPCLQRGCCATIMITHSRQLRLRIKAHSLLA